MLASFTAGLACGLLLFGESGAWRAQRPLLATALLLFALASWAAGRAKTMPASIAGAWLLTAFSWRTSFVVLAASATSA